MRSHVRSWLFLGIFYAIMLAGCKKKDDPVITTTITPTLVGNWGITAITFSPGWVQYTGATPIPDYIPYLAAKGQTCLTDLTISFTATGAYTTNSASLPACGNVPESKVILDYLFGDGRTFTETNTTAVLYSQNKTTSIPVTKSGTDQLISLQFVNDQDLSGQAVKTTYTVTMKRR
ncbi:hypothetical protein J2I47_23450 [Fibrella sp. HMF5335]|uniref:Lipocalin-like domain-containing protein n=1 Tax=Fibrella rubiginis TaxID=2817060 RepID=A0A939GJL9_9BACT|nr:hypothetical protein [Fibrella rubiginis]MBO0939526.1 hypothetical protein [Fibrella rubiginis]